jgi:vitamin B12 transporter
VGGHGDDVVRNRLGFFAERREILHDDVGGLELDAYTLLNLRADWTLADAWTIGARLENLTDRNYELVHGYNTPGRSGFVELTWHP